MTRLNMQLPITSPAAILGRSKMMIELIPVINSGREVTEAIKMTPIKVLPKPLFSARISPYFESSVPVKSITAVQAMNRDHTTTCHSSPTRLPNFISDGATTSDQPPSQCRPNGDLLQQLGGE